MLVLECAARPSGISVVSRSPRTALCASSSQHASRLGSAGGSAGQRVIDRRKFIAAALASSALACLRRRKRRAARSGAQSTAEEVTAGIDLTGMTAVVTGCNSGIGFETMRVLALRGAHVIGTARTREKGSRRAARVKRSRHARGAGTHGLRFRHRLRRSHPRDSRRASTCSS